MNPQAVAQLKAWFIALYEKRSVSGDILDFDPRYRVTWTEIFTKMKELGSTEGVVDARLTWNRILKTIKLGRDS